MRAAAAPPPEELPPAIEVAVGSQQEAIAIAISLLYCLHSALRRELDGGGRSEEMEGAEKAADWVQYTHITAMLLVRLNAVYLALDTVTLGRADVDPDHVRLTEEVREMRARIDKKENK